MRKKTTKDFINHKMNDDVYKLRRQVIDMIYEIKNIQFLFFGGKPKQVKIYKKKVEQKKTHRIFYFYWFSSS